MGFGVWCNKKDLFCDGMLYYEYIMRLVCEMKYLASYTLFTNLGESLVRE